MVECPPTEPSAPEPEAPDVPKLEPADAPKLEPADAPKPEPMDELMPDPADEPKPKPGDAEAAPTEAPQPQEATARMVVLSSVRLFKLVLLDKQGCHKALLLTAGGQRARGGPVLGAPV